LLVLDALVDPSPQLSTASTFYLYRNPVRVVGVQTRVEILVHPGGHDLLDEPRYLRCLLFGTPVAQITGEVYASAANRVRAAVIVKFDSSGHY